MFPEGEIKLQKPVATELKETKNACQECVCECIFRRRNEPAAPSSSSVAEEKEGSSSSLETTVT